MVNSVTIKAGVLLLSVASLVYVGWHGRGFYEEALYNEKVVNEKNTLEAVEKAIEARDAKIAESLLLKLEEIKTKEKHTKEIIVRETTGKNCLSPALVNSFNNRLSNIGANQEAGNK